MSDSAWKFVFAAAAIFNLIAGLPLLLAPTQGLAMMSLPPQPMMLFVQLAGGLIVMFGVAYAVVARNLALREIVWLGAIGKAMAVALLTIHWSAGQISDTVFVMEFGDVAFTLLFLWFLFGGRRAAA
jgi:hypothetical protein